MEDTSASVSLASEYALAIAFARSTVALLGGAAAFEWQRRVEISRHGGNTSVGAGACGVGPIHLPEITLHRLRRVH
jgi:hypothetical protein